MSKLAEQLLGNSRAAILATLLLRPDEEIHGRELARITNISPGTLHRELQTLAEMGVLARREVGRQVFYAANRAFPLFDDLASIMRKTAGVVDVLRPLLGPLGSRIRCAFVYGSIASGESTISSDIDLMIIGDADFSAVVRALSPAQATMRREINPVIMSVTEFNRKRTEKNGFVASVLRGQRLWLIGGEDDLPKPAKNRSA
ncbi:MAG: helix-turn-helix domain-containing protein [Betaproteobacteria bacterium]|nr:helix-turn-helix domain-containing protein [Betaproteobacteria bacterium]